VLEHLTGELFLARILIRMPLEKELIDLLLPLILLQTPQQPELIIQLILGLLQLNTIRYIVITAVRARRVRLVTAVTGIAALLAILLAVARGLATRFGVLAVGCGAALLGVARALRILEGLALVGRLGVHGVVDAVPVLQHVQVLLADERRLLTTLVDLHLELELEVGLRFGALCGRVLGAAGRLLIQIYGRYLQDLTVDVGACGFAICILICVLTEV
jgi:hypothetical protein